MAWFSRKQKLLTMRMKGVLDLRMNNQMENRNEKIIMYIGQAGLQIKFNVSFWSPNFSTRVPWPLQNDPHRCFVVIVHRSPPRSGRLRWLEWLRWFRWLDVEHSVRFNEQFLLPSSIGEWFVRCDLSEGSKETSSPSWKRWKWFPKLLLSYKYVRPKHSFSNKL